MFSRDLLACGALCSGSGSECCGDSAEGDTHAGLRLVGDWAEGGGRGKQGTMVVKFTGKNNGKIMVKHGEK